MADLFSEIQKLGALRRKEQILTSRHSKATTARKEQERLVHDLMVDTGFEEGDSVKFKGLRYSAEHTEYAVVQDKAALIEHLRENDESLIEEKLRKGELNRLVREKLDNGEALPPGLGYYVDPWVGIKGISGQINKQEEDNDE